MIVWAYYNAPQAIVNPVHQVLFFLGEGLVKMTLGLVQKYTRRVFSVFRNMPEASVSYRKMAEGQGVKLTFFTPYSGLQLKPAHATTSYLPVTIKIWLSYISHWNSSYWTL